jgi:hypothetical protein
MINSRTNTDLHTFISLLASLPSKRISIDLDMPTSFTKQCVKYSQSRCIWAIMSTTVRCAWNRKPKYVFVQIFNISWTFIRYLIILFISVLYKQDCSMIQTIRVIHWWIGEKINNTAAGHSGTQHISAFSKCGLERKKYYPLTLLAE